MSIKKILQNLFKKIGYKVYFLIYGKIENIIKDNQTEKIITKLITINKKTYKIFSILNGRLYTTRIHDTAFILQNNIIDEVSFQYRYSKENISLKKVNENIVFKNGTPRLKKFLNGTVASLLTGGGGNDNYFHWLFDVLPRLALIEKYKNLNEIDHFILPNLEHKFQIQTLDLLNIPIDKRLSSVIFRHVSATNLIATTHPYVISDPVKDVQAIPSWISIWLKNKFIKNLNFKKFSKNIYIEREEKVNNNPFGRSIINEDDVKKFLLNKNFTAVKLKELNFIDQVQLFSQANCIIGLHGAGFANLVFCKEKTKVIEIKSTTTDKLYYNLANVNNLLYDSIIISPKNNEASNQQGNLLVPIDELKDKVNKI